METNKYNLCSKCQISKKETEKCQECENEEQTKRKERIKTYKDIESLKKSCVENSGKPFNIWTQDKGLRVNNKTYALMEYGNMLSNFQGNNYITFRHMPYKKRQTFYNNNVLPHDYQDEFITIEYGIERSEDGTSLFIFKLLRENW